MPTHMGCGGGAGGVVQGEGRSDQVANLDAKLVHDPKGWKVITFGQNEWYCVGSLQVNV